MVSIIVPVYNAEKYLDTCITSLVNQEYRDIEIIVVDDGSTDNSLQICRDFALQDNRIKVFTQENQGQGSARNRALSEAKGEYILFVDSDDAIAADTISSNCKYLEKFPNLDFIQFPLFQEYGTEQAYVRHGTNKYFKKDNDFIELALNSGEISWIVCDKIFRSSLIKNRRFETDMKYEDNYFIMQLLPVLQEFYSSNTGMYFYYFRENSTTTSVPSELKEKSTAKVLDYTLSILRNNRNSALFYQYFVRLINVEKSLRVNFKKRVFYSYKYKKDIKLVNIITCSNSFRDMVKLIIFKLFA